MEQKKLQELLAEMSLEEKVDQLLQVGGAYYEEEGMITGPDNKAGFTEEELQLAGTVLGSIGAAKLKKIQKEYMEKQPHHIPLIFMADIINGYRTIFPIPLAQGCSFDPGLVREGAEVAAKESAAAGLHLTFSPMVDLVRDSRWGRVMESPGEDVYLNRCMARAMVEGYQGTDLRENGRIAACVKHFAGYGAPMGGRDYHTVELSERSFRDDYLPAYREAVDAGVASAMTSFNTIDRVPATGNKKLMREVLRKEMGFQGVLISDWAAIEELIAHGVAGSQKQAAKLAIEAGVDIDMMTPCYCKNLAQLIEEGSVPEAMVDEAVLRILELKNALGLFENPYKDADELAEQELILSEAHRKAARKAAADTFVLLQNKDLILPLKKEGQKLAFIGPHASNKWIFGGWSLYGRKEESISIEEGIRNKKIEGAVFAKGAAMLDDLSGLELFEGILDPDTVDLTMEDTTRNELMQEAILTAEAADTVVLALGEHPLLSGEAASRSDLTLSDCQMKLFRKITEVNPNTIVVLFSGRPLAIEELKEGAKAILQVWMPGTEGGNAIADVLFGDVNPSAKLSMSFPRCVGQLPMTYSALSTGRPYKEGNPDKYLSKYLDVPNTPLYPFGYGLSYTTFEISGISLNQSQLTKGEVLTAAVTVKNAGKAAGKEVLQLYIQDLTASVARPVRELKGFQKVELLSGEEKNVTFEITEEMLRFHNIDMNYVSEPGRFRLYIGNSSETENGAEFELE